AEERLRLIEELTASTPGLDATVILETLSHHLPALRDLGVAKIGLFGSYARGDARLDSDIDLLVYMADEHYSYSDLFDVQAYLQNLFTPKLDLVPEDSLKPRIRTHILDEVIYAS